MFFKIRNKIEVIEIKDCQDGTKQNKCSDTQPNFCLNGSFMKNPEKCGCPNGFRVYKGNCIPLIICNDGTNEPECSKTKPYQCIEGKLILQASVCGCPEGEQITGNYCQKIT